MFIRGKLSSEWTLELAGLRSSLHRVAGLYPWVRQPGGDSSHYSAASPASGYWCRQRAEATGANVFFVKNNVVHTPKPDCFLNGITRQTVIQILKNKGIEVVERHILPNEMEDFEQCWLTGTAAEVTPVGKVEQYNFEVGALTREVSKEYENLVRS